MATDDDDIPDTGAVFTFGKSRFADNTANKFWIKNDKVIHVSCGDDHTAFVTATGRLYTFGANDWGQLGVGHTKSSNKPASVKALKQDGVVLVGCGRLHTIACTKAGQLYAFGAGGEGQLGGGDTQGAETPIPIGSLEDAKYEIITCGTDHTAVLTAEGTLFMCGGSSDGQLGLGSLTETEIPKELSLGIAIKHVSCGYYHTALVTEDGKLYTFGENEMGKLGLGDDEVDVSSNTPRHVDSIEEPVQSVSCGNKHTAAITESGSLYTFGDGSHGQLGQGPSLLQLNTPRKVTRLSKRKCRHVSCGESHTAIVTESGCLYSFGDGRHGKLGQGEESFCNLFTPTKVSRFKGFYVEQVSCGGCHMIVRARRRDTSNGELSDESDSEETDPLKMSSSLHARLQSTIGDIDNKLEHSLDLNASLGGTARGRRRQKESSPLPPLARTLPPLGGTGTPRSQLSSLSATTKPSLNPLNQGLLPNIKHEQDEMIKNKQRTNDDEESSEDETDGGSQGDPFATRFVSASGNWHDLQPLSRNRSHKTNSVQTHFSRSGARQDMKPLVNAMHKAKRKEKQEQMKAKQNGIMVKPQNGKTKHMDEEESEEEEESDEEDEDEEDSDEDESEDEDAIQKTRQQMKQKAQLDKEKQLKKETPEKKVTPKKALNASRPVPAVRTSKVAKKPEESEDDDDEDEETETEEDEDETDEEEKDSKIAETKPVPSKRTKSNNKPDTPNKKPTKSSKEDNEDSEEENDDEDEKKKDKLKDDKNKNGSKKEETKDKKDNTEPEEEIKAWQFWKRKKKTEPEPQSVATSSGDQNSSKTCTIL